MKHLDGSITAPLGFLAAGLHCGIRKNRLKKDLMLIFAEKPCDAAAVYTQNRVKGAPIVVTQKNLASGSARAVICNSGNANTCNADGIEKAEQMCAFAAQALGIRPDQVVVASTGVIGLPLPIAPIKKAVPSLAKALSREGSIAAVDAIMTTDTRRKQFAVEFELGGKACRIGGIAKGSGMIHPNMATMLSFLTTDADIEPALLYEALLDTARETFNMVSIDGDTSTNDMACILASGLAGNARVTARGAEYDAFREALGEVCTCLAREIARDGEGASRLLECRVTGAKCTEDAREAAKSVIGSSLVKAAMFGADANWGRVLCALGYSAARVDPLLVDVAFSSKGGRVNVCKSGTGLDFSEEEAAAVLKCDEVVIHVDLNENEASAVAWGCDLTYGYVKINGDYRT
ncbi:MAG: bifunctional glutamate N-acetyltransferase/amino-acid acetyltransferase ArgJ [Clostridia bacterium]|nr:bifunctional glutamate N-acetyltransferase/amino-acid acetyltransferase ArgJ [Clostridia bacterium]